MVLAPGHGEPVAAAQAGRLGRWLLPVVLAVAAWPVTVVAVIGCGAAWLRGWPPARLRRAALVFLPFTAMWLVIDALQLGGWRGIGPALVRGWERGWRPLTVLGVTRAFLLVSLVAIPAGLGLAALGWWWRNYAVTSGIGGWLASAPVTFDVRQWKHQVWRAGGVNKAPGAVPLLARGGVIPVGGTIRAVGHRWRSVFTVAHAACGRHMVIVGATGTRQDEPDDAAVGGLVHRRDGRGPGGARPATAADRAGLQGRPGRPGQGGAHPPAAATARAPGGWRSGPTRPGCRCGTCRRPTWPCCCSR